MAGQVREAVFICHCTHLVLSYFACTVCMCICLFSPGVPVLIFALMFSLHVLCVALLRHNKLPHPPRAQRLCPFGVCFSLLSFCLKPALSYHPRSLSLGIAHSLPRSPHLSLSPCEVCDLCNFIPPVTGDIS